MAVNIDFSTIEISTGTDAPRLQPKTGKSSLDDVFIDVTADSEIESQAADTTRSRRLISRRDQLSLCSALLFLWTSFLFGLCLGDSSAANQPQPLVAYRVDLNSAGLEELVLLEGIGEVTAEKIIVDREVNGPFLAEDDLQRVKGIGPKTLERLRDHVVCR